MAEPTLLIVDEEYSALETVTRTIEAEGKYRVLTESDPAKVISRLETEAIDLVLCDVNLTKVSGAQLVESIRNRHYRLPVVIYSDRDNSAQIIDAMERGATNYLKQPLEPRQLAKTMEAALSNIRLAGEVEKLKRRLGGDHKLGGLVGRSAAMHRVFDAIREVCTVDSTVLIRAETGTGKELVARALHFEGPRSDQPFVKVNCAALPETLLESELFGHEKGSFTDAKQTRIGKFEQANGGTIFLDEIGELSMSIQVKLLNVLQDREVEKIGSNRRIPIDVRVITATNRDLERMVQEGRFRLDLYYRLNVVPITVPPLRERREDIPLLCSHFLEKIGGRLHKEKYTITDEAMAMLLGHHWPGNVRELENVIERAILAAPTTTINEEVMSFLTRGAQIQTEFQMNSQAMNTGGMLSPTNMVDNDTATLMSPGPLKAAVKEFERRFIESALRASGGHVIRASRLLKIDRTTLWKKARDLGINMHNDGM
ncbi:sigma-54-dependent Fis family transcriptional regulator [bacterium]|nr:MAG: sigma-54-dependent Fis family transcriptional regulator [bacterium]